MSVKISGPGGRQTVLRQNSDINVTPFVDVMLVLLIVMMVAAPMATRAIRIDAPPNPSNAKGPPPSFVSVRSDGRIVVFAGAKGAQPTDLRRLSDLLLADRGPDARAQTILIRADRTARYADFMAVVNQLQADGYFKLALITEDAPASPSA